MGNSRVKNDSIETDFENMLHDIDIFTKALGKESNVVVYFLLDIFGAMAPREIEKVSSLGRATVFRSLKELTSFGIIGSELDLEIKDKRMNKRYFIEKDIGEEGTEIDDRFLDYLERTNNLDVLKNLSQLIQTLSMAVSRIVAGLFAKRASTLFADYKKDVREEISYTVLIRDEEDIEGMSKKVKDFVESLTKEKDSKKSERNKKMPMKNPIMLSVGLFPLKLLKKDRSEK